MLERILFIVLLIGIPLALGIFIDRFVIGVQPSVETVTVVRERVEVANLDMNITSLISREDVVIPPQSVFIQPFISTRSSIMTIRIELHSYSTIDVFVAIESDDELALLQPSYSIEAGKVLIYKVPIPAGIGAIALLNTGIEKAVVDLEIHIAD